MKRDLARIYTNNMWFMDAAVVAHLSNFTSKIFYHFSLNPRKID